MAQNQQISLTRINFPYSFLRWAEEIAIVIDMVVLPKRYADTDTETRRVYQTTDEYRRLCRWRALYASLSVPSTQFYQSFQYCQSDRDRFDIYWRFVRNEIKAPESLIGEVNLAHERFRSEAEALANEHREHIKQIKADCGRYVRERKTLYDPPINAQEEGV